MPIEVTFPDGSVKGYPDGSTGRDVAESISKGLAKAALAAKVGGEIRDLNRPLPARCELVLLKEGSPEALEVQRHSAAHVMAGAVRRLFGPEARFGVGPPVEDGFYYDMDLPRKITEEDLPRIEEEMRKIVREDFSFVRQDLPKEQVVRRMREMGQEYKLEILEGIGEETASLYTDGDFVDLCEGPHVPSTGRIGAFKLDRITGAYWRGDSRNRMLTRVYGLLFANEKALKEHLDRREEAKRRDHRRLGKDLELFAFHEWSPGSPILLPKGTLLYNELLRFLRAEYRKRGYQEVITPQLFHRSLWEQSGHWEHFKDDMFVLTSDEAEYSLKPMNCPSHCLIYQMRKHSYRDLPLRMADFCYLHRNELRGVLGGMTRVRKFSQDDAHIFCTPEQMPREIRGTLDFVRYVYGEVFGMEFQAKLSTRPEKAMGEPDLWERAEGALRSALTEAKMPYLLKPGEGAFYGPKIDFDLKDAIGRTWQCATIQLDFQMPIRFDLKYVAADNSLQRTVMIHRAILGSLERFLAVLTEHYCGEFPAWLAPVQVRVLPVTDRDEEYAREVNARLDAEGFRSEIDLSNERISYKIRTSTLLKVPYMLIVGGRERESELVAVRDRKAGDLGQVSLSDFLGKLRREIEICQGAAPEAGTSN